MIIDSHVYTFLSMDDPRGYGSGVEHVARVQASHAGHHQPAIRLSDLTRSESSVLNPENEHDWDRLPDVNFRLDKDVGRVVWTVDEEDYTKHYFPPNLRNLEFSVHSLIGEMDYAGVDVALIHTDPMLVRDSSYLSECLALYPNRLRSMAPVDEWRILSDIDTVINETTTAIVDHGLNAIKFNTPLVAGHQSWADIEYKPFWDAVTDLEVPVFFTLGTGQGKRQNGPSLEERDGYLEELSTLTRWMDRYPDAVCSLTHGFPWRVFLDGDRIALPDNLWAPFENKKLSLEVCFPVRLGDIFDYPYEEVWETLEQMVLRIGADNLLWGTDMPFQNRFCTYQQSRKWIESYCKFLSDAELASVMGNTAGRILGIDTH
ncbi:amidohydrolase [Dehalococcoidia bacterium]|nr:amidohydrolase [Dehalococcoidia bacterium]